jgi:hypothetical protein
MTWGVGAVIAVLLPAAAYLFNLAGLSQMFSLILLFLGLWTLVSAFSLVETGDRYYYAGWGVVMAALSLFYYIPVNYAFGLILLAIVALILLNVYVGRSGKMLKAATSPPPPAGDTPAAAPT